MLNAQLFIRKQVLYIRFNGELDQHTVGSIRIKVIELIDKYQIRYLVLNFKYLNFMDSSGIGFIIGRFNRLKLINGSIILCAMNEQIKRIVMLSGLTKICTIKSDEDDVNEYLGVQLKDEKICKNAI